MKFKNYIHKSGYVLKENYLKEEISKAGVMLLKRKGVDKSFLKPKSNPINLSSPEIISIDIDLNEMFQDLYEKAIHIKDEKVSLTDAIISSANKWGFLRNGSMIEISNEVKFSKLNGSFINQLYQGAEEYKYWKLLLQKVIPHTQDFLKFYLRANKMELSLSELNDCINGSVPVYKSLKRSSYDVIPLDLLAAITIFSQTKRDRREKDATIICAYEKCNNEVPNNLGKGRSRKTCSNSCRTLLSRHRTK